MVCKESVGDSLPIMTNGNSNLTAIGSSKLLVVGAGGIGSELLKGLVQAGFQTIDIVDMDTIDVSNLNRQFLFRKIHVGKSKAEVARQSILERYPSTNITAYCQSIINPEMGVNWFKKYDVVINALDNVAARSHVNRMCLSAARPLLDTGTAGYQGQVELIIKGLTKCYECEPKPKQKTYPNCTIRNTPSEPIHCIVWAKHLFNQLFGLIDADEDVSPDMNDPELVGEVSAEMKESAPRVSTRDWAQQCGYDPRKLFEKLFHEDIDYLLRLTHLWISRQKPVPLSWMDAANSGSTGLDSDKVLPDQRVWSIKECVDVFVRSVSNLKLAYEKVSKDGNFLDWDKDDKDAMDFVAACANVRSYVFGIARKSRFDTKSMAGNIIPAIATSNAIIAATAVMYATKIVTGRSGECKTVYLRKDPNHIGILMLPEKDFIPPNPNCLICSLSGGECSLKVFAKYMTLKNLDGILKKELHFAKPEVIFDLNQAILIDCEDEESLLGDYGQRTLDSFGVKDGSLLIVDEGIQDLKLKVIICDAGGDSAIEIAENERDSYFEVLGDGTSKPTGIENRRKVEEMEEDGDDLVIIGDTPSVTPELDTSVSRKRKLGENRDDAEVQKLPKIDVI